MVTAKVCVQVILSLLNYVLFEALFNHGMVQGMAWHSSETWQQIQRQGQASIHNVNVKL